jgi:hypothetical protein
VQEGAFGRPGEDGDAEAIRHMAMRLNSIYEDLIDWTARVRGAILPAEFAGTVELLGNVSGHTISAYRKFVDTFVAQNDRLPEQIATGKPMTPDLTVTFSIPDEMVEAIRAELRRVAEVFGRRQRPDGSRAGPPGTGQLRPSPPPPRVSHIANANANANAFQLGQHGIDGLVQEHGWRRIHSAARNSLGGPGRGWSAVRATGWRGGRRRVWPGCLRGASPDGRRRRAGLGRTRRHRPGLPHGPRRTGPRPCPGPRPGPPRRRPRD